MQPGLAHRSRAARKTRLHFLNKMSSGDSLVSSELWKRCLELNLSSLEVPGSLQRHVLFHMGFLY